MRGIAHIDNMREFGSLKEYERICVYVESWNISQLLNVKFHSGFF